jgi:hypothetical protein
VHDLDEHVAGIEDPAAGRRARQAPQGLVFGAPQRGAGCWHAEAIGQEGGALV